MAHPFARILREFPTDGSANLELVARRRVTSGGPVGTDPSIEMKLAEAYEKGRADAEAQAQAAVEQHHLEQVAAFGEQLEAAKRSFSDQVAKTLTDDLKHLIDQFKEQISSQVVSALLPVFRHALTEAAIREFALAIRDLAPDNQTVLIQVRGPEELLNRVEASYVAAREAEKDGKEPAIKFLPGDGFELQARVNDTVIETRLMEWIGKISEAAG